MQRKAKLPTNLPQKSCQLLGKQANKKPADRKTHRPRADTRRSVTLLMVKLSYFEPIVMFFAPPIPS